MKTEPKRVALPKDSRLQASRLRRHSMFVALMLFVFLVFVLFIKVSVFAGLASIIACIVGMYFWHRRMGLLMSQGIQAMHEDQLELASEKLHQAAYGYSWTSMYHPLSLNNLAVLYLRQGNIDEALSIMSAGWDYKDLFTPQSKCWYASMFAEFWSYAGDCEAAEEWLSLAKEQEGHGLDVLIFQAESILRAREGKYEEVLQLCDECEQSTETEGIERSTSIWRGFANTQLGVSFTPELGLSLQQWKNMASRWPALQDYLSRLTPVGEAPGQQEQIIIKPKSPKSDPFQAFWLIVSFVILFAAGHAMIYIREAYHPVSFNHSLYTFLGCGFLSGLLWVWITHRRLKKQELDKDIHRSALIKQSPLGFLAFMLIGIAGLLLVNGGLDSSKESTIQIKILNVRHNTNKKYGLTSWVRFKSPLPPHFSDSLYLHGKNAHNVKRGAKTITFTIRKGALGIPWRSKLSVP